MLPVNNRPGHSLIGDGTFAVWRLALKKLSNALTQFVKRADEGQSYAYGGGGLALVVVVVLLVLLLR